MYLQILVLKQTPSDGTQKNSLLPKQQTVLYG
jgi:hypothetical protein